MTDYYVGACTGGHLIQSEKVEIVDTRQFGKDGIYSFDDGTEISYDISEDYCSNCGGKVLTECPNCQSNLQIEYHGSTYPSDEHVPSFCNKCGEPFPWIATVEAEKQREGKFLEIDDSEIDGHFYPNLVYEINLCYKVKADQALLVLNRKLIESLIVDIMRSVFTMENVDLFYDTENKKTHSLSMLLQNMKDRNSEFKKYGISLDERFFRAVNELKHRGDASAHAIEENPSREDIAEKSGLATDMAKILFRLRTEAKTAHRD